MLSRIIGAKPVQWANQHARAFVSAFTVLMTLAISKLAVFADNAGANNVVNGAGGMSGGSMSAESFGKSFSWIVGFVQVGAGFIMVLVVLALFIRMGWNSGFGDARSQGNVIQGMVFVAIAIFGIVQAPMFVTYIAHNSASAGAALLPLVTQSF